MTFTFDASIAEDRDRIRSAIRDIEWESGPLPGDKNFTDEELDDFLDREGHWGRAVAHSLEILASSWRIHPSFQADSMSISRSHISRGFSDDAKQWRKQYGYSDASPVATTVYLTRRDGYSDDLDATETATL